MKKLSSAGVLCALVALLCVPAMGQDGTYESTEVTTTETSSGYRDLDAPALFYDANPQETGTMQFKLIWEYETSSVADDDTGLKVEWEWGCCDNIEFSLKLPMNLGDGGDMADGGDGNYDLHAAMTYRLWDDGEIEWLPAFALRAEVRGPTGTNSDGWDGELRAILTKHLGGECRGHINAFAKTVNGTNEPDARDFQWGVVIGADAPIAEDLWLLVDYMHRSSEEYGSANMNILEAGVEWRFAEGQGLHFTTQFGLDDNENTPNWGGKLSYTYELRL